MPEVAISIALRGLNQRACMGTIGSNSALRFIIK